MEDLKPNGINNNNSYRPGDSRGYETATLVLGAISIACVLFGVFAFVGVGCGIGGVICGHLAKKNGVNTTGVKMGFIFSVIGLVICALVLLLLAAFYGFMGYVLIEGIDEETIYELFGILDKL